MRELLRATGLLRVLLVLLFGALLLAQIVILPQTLAEMAEESPEHVGLRWPMLVFLIVELLGVQIVIVCTWKLLTLVREDRIFSEGSFAWVDAIVWTVAAAWVLLLGVFGYFALAWGLSGLPVLLAVLVLVGAVVGLLVIVLRALLRQATTLRTDMEAVI